MITQCILVDILRSEGVDGIPPDAFEFNLKAGEMTANEFTGRTGDFPPNHRTIKSSGRQRWAVRAGFFLSSFISSHFRLNQGAILCYAIH